MIYAEKDRHASYSAVLMENRWLKSVYVFFSVIFLGLECCLTLKQLSSTYSCHARLNTIETGGDFQLQSETMPVRPQSNQSLHFDGAINKSVHL